MAAEPDKRLAALLQAASDARGECLGEPQWEQLALGELGAPEREAALRHLLGCPGCAAIYRGLAALAAEAPSLDPQARPLPQFPPFPKLSELAPARSTRWRRLAFLAGAGGGLLAAAALLFSVRSGPDSVRAAKQDSPISLIEPSGPQPSRPASLRWKAPPGARCSPELRAADGSVVWSAPASEATEAPLPASVPLGAGRWFWQLDCGPGLGRSGLAGFSLP